MLCLVHSCDFKVLQFDAVRWLAIRSAGNNQRVLAGMPKLANTDEGHFLLSPAL